MIFCLFSLSCNDLLLGVRWGLQSALEQGINSLIIAYDAVNIVNCILGKCFIARIDLVLQDCKQLQTIFLLLELSMLRDILMYKLII
jgi:hypothetical protein